MPSRPLSHALTVFLGLGLTACSAPPRVAYHPESPPRRLELPGTASDPEMVARSWIESDPSVRRAQAAAGDVTALPTPPAANPDGLLADAASPSGQPIGLEQALYGAITSNPDLISIRQNAPATREAVEVARQFPALLNPTVFVNPRPGVFEKNTTGRGYHAVQGYFNFSLRQPIETGHQTTHRYAIAKAAHEQATWNIAQAEMTALIQTYRFFQTSAYRREKLRLAGDLVRFNERLVTTLRKGLENNLIQAADVALAEVEREAVEQQVDAARQDYAIALADLQNQIGRPEDAGSIEPLGEFVLPPYIPEAEDEVLIRRALASRADIRAAYAGVCGAMAAIRLAKGDRYPTFILGPEYTRDEFGNQFAGLVFVAPLPILNAGGALVRQREAEYRRAATAYEQVKQRAVTQVKVATAKWNAANRLVQRTSGTTDSLKEGVGRLERLFDENQADLAKLLQARQRLIQLENARLDATWQATQAQADLLTAIGAPDLLASLQGQMAAGPAASPAMPPPLPATP